MFCGDKDLNDLHAIADEVMQLLGSNRQVVPFSARAGGLSLEQAYGVVDHVKDQRHARGESAIGRKIGFTNTAVWQGYGLAGPIWNHMFDTTVFELAAFEETFALPEWPEPRIEPEIVLHLARAPTADMSDAELLACIDWIAPGFELVYSIYPGWAFTAADATAAFGLHGVLLLGERMALSGDLPAFNDALRTFTVDLRGPAGAHHCGHARNVLGGPISALRFLVAELLLSGPGVQLRAGELITTGTLTTAAPITHGQTWTMGFSGLDLTPATVRMR